MFIPPQVSPQAPRQSFRAAGKREFNEAPAVFKFLSLDCFDPRGNLAIGLVGLVRVVELEDLAHERRAHVLRRVGDGLGGNAVRIRETDGIAESEQ